MNAPRGTQIFALVFQPDGSVSVGVEPTSAAREICVPNTDEGLSRLLDWMNAQFDRSRQPLLCCAAASGASTGGLIFEELLSSDEVPRFAMAQPFYLNFATEVNQDSSLPATLLQAARVHAPGVNGAA
ncbi:hypothetical protein HZ992_15100 [Rhizobacter sp. AJA081-3]|uniref:hypothetical protein n=1 Tax=Rhizobacter sp. AJA081-3 TaxID=2753607 RepID=UPI001AE0935C|nr:hypothetical protein [Rhizobacter sp. AJA081-3]QTN21511.1 hypothetical protein HZ992_15100 [Rhizobacter sp. AJA081-3]